MRIRGFDALDLVGGVIVIVGGCALALGATAYPIGQLNRMGPGYLPLVTGVILALIGLGLVVGSRAASNIVPHTRPRAIAAVFAGLIFWALTIETLGLAPATLGLVVIVSFAQERPSPFMIGVTAAFLIVFSVVVFVYALAVPIPVVRLQPWI